MENVVQMNRKEELFHNEAAAYVKLKPRTLYNRNQAGTGPRSTMRFGRRKYLPADLDAWLKSEGRVKEAYS